MTNIVKTICCIGAGYVGGPTMAVIANKCPNIQVKIVDINKERISNWNNADLSKLPIYEPGLDELISKTRGKNLHFSTNVQEAIATADMIFLSVNTPTKTKGFGAGQASDLRWIEASSREVAAHAKGHTIVVEKSTLPVRTAATIKKILEGAKGSIFYENEDKQSFSVLSNPEFLAEGTAIKDLENPDRVLIGGDDKEAIAALVNIYLNWIDESKILTTNIWSSELSKLTANAFLAQRISSINSISALCEATDADINEVGKAIGMDSRIGEKFLQPGPGFGGSCFKKDILNLVYISNYYGLNKVASYWEKVIDINNWQQHRISRIVVENLFETVANKKISILGFSFKSNTNDTRESPAINICKDLIDEGAKLAIYDPKVKAGQIQHDLGVEQSAELSTTYEKGAWKSYQSILDSAEESDAILVLTEWEEFKDLNWKEISRAMRSPSWLFDTRGICNKELAKKSGLNVWELGNTQI